MKKLSLFLFGVIMIVDMSCSRKNSEDLVLVKGGTFVNTKSNLYGKNVKISDFYIGRHEIAQEEWVEVMGSNPSNFKGENLPVEMVSWYDCIEYCNRRSIKEGLQPYYNIDKDEKDPANKNDLDSIKWIVTINTGAGGYRLPTEVEWEYAAGGGSKSRNFTYSGSNEVDDVAWYWENSGDKILTGSWNWSLIEKNNNATKPTGLKESNELGIYDMSGNVREWCSDWYEDAETKIGFVRVQRGGGWLGADYRCEVTNRHHFDANGRGPDQGFRVCRSAHAFQVVE